MGLLDGQYTAMTSGRSLDFDDLRSYVRGDDVKDIDWKSSARAGELLVKRYRAERRHTLAFVVPAGGPLASAATLTQSKADVVLASIGVLAWIACRHGDYVTWSPQGRMGRAWHDRPTVTRRSSTCSRDSMQDADWRLPNPICLNCSIWLRLGCAAAASSSSCWTTGIPILMTWMPWRACVPATRFLPSRCRTLM